MKHPSGTSSVIDVPPLSVRAEVGSYNAEERTVELIFSTGAAVERYDWMSGKRYIEKLSMDPKSLRLERLNAGAPLLDSHSSYSVTDQLGAVVPGSVRFEKGKALATVKFSAREAVAPILGDVRDGIIRHVSVGYRVHRFEEEQPKGDKLPIRTATDWEPYEISMVSMPADTGAKVRRDQIETNSCVIVSRQERTMDPVQQRTDGQSEFIVEQTDEQVNQDRLRMAADPPPAEPSTAEVAMKAERERCQGILLACRAARMPSSAYDKFVADGTALVDAQRQIFVEMEKRVDPNPMPNQGARRIEMGDDPLVHKRAGIENALLNRVSSTHFKLEDIGREYRGMTLLDIAKVYLTARGVRVTQMQKMEIAGAALGLTQVRTGGMHTTSDFPLLLADVANKSLRAEYLAAPQTFQPITRSVSLSDFKASNRVQIGDAPALKLVNEHGEFTRGTIAEGREQIQLATYGRVFAITRKALVNDDTDAFSRVPAKFGRAARNLESDLAWYQILSNPTMGDSVALFHASHENYVAAGGIGVSNISDAERAMMLQTGLDGTTLIMASPKYLIVPPSQKTAAMQFVSTLLQAAVMGNVNPFAGQLTVIVEPRLETGITIGATTAAGSAFAWYLAADPSQVDILELATLDGQEGPMVESRVGFDVDGLEIKCRHDVGAKVIDHRGLYKSDGSDNS